MQQTPEAIQLSTQGHWESFDAAISTLPLPVLSQIVRGRLTESLPLERLSYQGIVNAVVLLKNRLQTNYSTTIIQKDFPFQHLVEATHVMPLSQTGGLHVVHLLNYCDRSSAAYGQTDADIEFQAHKVLQSFDPSFKHESVEEIKVFRAPFVEPVWPLGYLRDKPRMRCGDSRLYLATNAQCYPAANSWNTMVGVANDIAARLQFDLDYAAQVSPAGGREFSILGLRATGGRPRLLSWPAGASDSD
jgi:protoporphyrinogen oxidase